MLPKQPVSALALCPSSLQDDKNEHLGSKPTTVGPLLWDQSATKAQNLDFQTMFKIPKGREMRCLEIWQKEKWG